MVAPATAGPPAQSLLGRTLGLEHRRTMHGRPAAVPIPRPPARSASHLLPPPVLPAAPLLLALAFAFAVLGSGGPAPARALAEDAPPRRVLVLFPTEPGDGDSIAALLEQGLRDTLRASGGGVAAPVVFTEYLDVSRLPDPALQRAQLQWLRRKYADQPPHAVVAFGTSTARRLELLDGPLFPGVPSVFAALDPLLFPDLVLPPDSDALWLRYDVGETLGAALRLQPAARRVVLVSGTADFDRAMLALARREVAPYTQRATIEEITDLPLEEVLRRVAALPPEAVVLYLSLNLDSTGTPLPSGEGLRRVVAASGAPVYANTETSVGGGVVGGAVTSYATRRRRRGPGRPAPARGPGRRARPRRPTGPEVRLRLAPAAALGAAGGPSASWERPPAQAPIPVGPVPRRRRPAPWPCSPPRAPSSAACWWSAATGAGPRGRWPSASNSCSRATPASSRATPSCRSATPRCAAWPGSCWRPRSTSGP